MHSVVLDFPTAAGQQSMTFMHTINYIEVADLATDLCQESPRVVVLDTRSDECYVDSHIPGALSFPWQLMDAFNTMDLDRQKTCIVYGDGLDPDNVTTAASRLVALGFTVQVLQGGIERWVRHGHTLAKGDAPGQMASDFSVFQWLSRTAIGSDGIK